MTSATAAIVLAGGRSTRMGTPKGALEWHGSTLLRHATGIVARVVDGPVVVVRAAGQELPALAAGVEVAQDAREGRGPLEAIAAGLAAVGGRAQAVYVTGVDAPFLHPAFVRRVLELLGPHDDVALPRADGFAQPLAAAYRATVDAPLSALLREDRHLGTAALMRRCRVHELGAEKLLADPVLAALDPGLLSLRNVNEPGEYEAARAQPAPLVTVDVDGSGPRSLRAATLAGAALAAHIALLDGVRADVNGRAVADPLEPLATGDLVELRSHS
ncbi:MAG: molybdenum cofactor guanylyltransferase [Solirubrobacteraceae bacterium]|nr:molybdenum cofactor guanylyltransferase [Solirubrobacteraceae bacterium]